MYKGAQIKQALDYKLSESKIINIYKDYYYTQFDDAIEMGLHSYNSQGYFIYSRDGFGPITHTIEETVDEIVRYIEQGCKNDNEYMDRASEFFKFNDYDNCKRTYEEDLNLK